VVQGVDANKNINSKPCKTVGTLNLFFWTLLEHDPRVIPLTFTVHRAHWCNFPSLSCFWPLQCEKFDIGVAPVAFSESEVVVDGKSFSRLGVRLSISVKDDDIFMSQTDRPGWDKYEQYQCKNKLYCTLYGFVI